MAYTVTDTREVSTLTPAGTERKVFRAWIVTGNGATGSIDVPVDKWNANDLPAILEKKAVELDLAFTLADYHTS